MSYDVRTWNKIVQDYNMHLSIYYISVINRDLDVKILLVFGFYSLILFIYLFPTQTIRF